jgi:hypothetical protein
VTIKRGGPNAKVSRKNKETNPDGGRSDLMSLPPLFR